MCESEPRTHGGDVPVFYYGQFLKCCQDKYELWIFYQFSTVNSLKHFLVGDRPWLQKMRNFLLFYALFYFVPRSSCCRSKVIKSSPGGEKVTQKPYIGAENGELIFPDDGEKQ